jgi:hypothetical protein
MVEVEEQHHPLVKVTLRLRGARRDLVVMAADILEERRRRVRRFARRGCATEGRGSQRGNHRNGSPEHEST